MTDRPSKPRPCLLTDTLLALGSFHVLYWRIGLDWLDWIERKGDYALPED